ncbi:MAG TPA: (Fe-S)-binding protein, partial [Methanomassiliicoccales archaeon]|nr:(Fe-S)-binding protein [Methanomassiliicoccales archaeon]
MPTAIEVFKLLPKKNCGKCNFPTCLAFAMQIANSKAKLNDCPFVSDEAKMQLAASAAPPIRLVKFGSGKRMVEMGDETELYRHEKKFFHPTAFAGTVSDALTDEEVAGKLETFAKMRFERVGQILELDAIVVKYESKDPVRFAEVAGLVALRTDKAIVLRAGSADALRDAAARIKDRVPLLDGATKENHEAIAA